MGFVFAKISYVNNNVNLGRNFPAANWKADIETANGLLKNGGGKSPGSEPEAAALVKLTRQLRPRLEVSFHAQGSLVGAKNFLTLPAILIELPTHGGNYLQSQLPALRKMLQV